MPPRNDVNFSPEETAIIMYFTSRGAPPAVSSEVIKLKCSTEQDAKTCTNGVKRFREDMQKKKFEDPYNPKTKGYNSLLVDHYLDTLGLKWEEVETLLTLDAEVLEIMFKHKVYYKSDNVKDVEHWALNMPWRAT